MATKNNSTKSATSGTKSEQHVGLGSEQTNVAAGNCASGNMQEMKKVLEIRVDESCRSFKADEDAVRVLGNIISDWVPVSIYLEIVDLMRGMEPKLAMKVAHCIGDFCWGEGRTLTEIEFLDSHLLSLYKRIFDYAKSNGHKLEMCYF